MQCQDSTEQDHEEWVRCQVEGAVTAQLQQETASWEEVGEVASDVRSERLVADVGDQGWAEERSAVTRVLEWLGQRSRLRR